VSPLAADVAASPRTDIDGVWQRHVAARHAAHALDGRHGTGRWSNKTDFPVLYLGRPTKSVIVEAYRHLVDPVEDKRLLAHLEPRVLVTCAIAITDALDLRGTETQTRLDLPPDVLRSDTSDRDAYARCQRVARLAHQSGMHGIIAPAATGMGETLVLFADILPAAQRPHRSAANLVWETLPADPRRRRRSHLRAVDPPWSS
jgi:hypothetical protein